MGSKVFLLLSSASGPKPMERQLLEQTVKKEGGFTFWQVQDDVTLRKLHWHAPSSARNVPGASLHTTQVHPI